MPDILLHFPPPDDPQDPLLEVKGITPCPTWYPENGANADEPFYGVNKRASQVAQECYKKAHKVDVKFGGSQDTRSGGASHAGHGGSDPDCLWGVW